MFFSRNWSCINWSRVHLGGILSSADTEDYSRWHKMSGVYRSFLITGPEALVCLLLISWIHWLPYKSFTLCPETILKNPFPVAACQLYCMPAFPCHDRSLTFQSFGMSTLFCFIEFPLSLAVPCGETHTCTVWGAPGCWQWFSGLSQVGSAEGPAWLLTRWLWPLGRGWLSAPACCASGACCLWSSALEGLRGTQLVAGKHKS